MKANEIIEKVMNGQIAYFVTYSKQIMINKKTVEAFNRANSWLLKDEGNGYRLRTGKSSIYLFSNQLVMR